MAYIQTCQDVEWIDVNDYKSISRTNPYLTLFVTYHHSINLYLKKLNCAIGLVIHNANYLFDRNPSSTPKGYVHRYSEKIAGISRQKKNILHKLNFLIARSTSMKSYVQGLTDTPVVYIADIYIKARETTISYDQRTTITHIGRIDENLKNIEYLENIINYIQGNPKEMSINIVGNSKSNKITPGESIKVYNTYVSSDQLSKIIIESNYILFLPNREIRVKGSIENVGYSHIPGSIHDAARHMRHVLTPDWYPKDDLIKDLIIPYENWQDIIQTITNKNFEIKIERKHFKQRIDHSLREADKILSNIIRNQ